MKPINFDSNKQYPVIVSLHGGGGRGTDNRKQLRDWNKLLAEKKRRTEFPCHGVAPQSTGLWNAEHLKQIKEVIKGLPSVDMDRIYILGHSMGGHGTYILIQLDPDYSAAAAPSAGSGLKTTEDFIDPAKIKDLPIWAFHGDKDRVCPIDRDRKVFDDPSRLAERRPPSATLRSVALWPWKFYVGWDSDAAIAVVCRVARAVTFSSVVVADASWIAYVKPSVTLLMGFFLPRKTKASGESRF